MSEPAVDSSPEPEATTGPETAPLGMKAVCVVVGFLAVVAFLQGAYYLWQAELVVGSVGLLLIAAAVVEFYLARGLWGLDEWAWHAGVAFFGAATVFALARVVVFADVFAIVEFFLNGLVGLYIYRKRPYYDPDMAVDDRAAIPLLDDYLGPADPEERETAPLGMKVVCLLAGFATLVAFFQGTYYFWHPGDGLTLVGLGLVFLAALEGYVLYGLWHLERWAWFGAVALFAGAAVVAVVRVLLFGDSVATIEFIVNGLTALYVYHEKEWYAPDVTVDVTPEPRRSREP